MLRFNLISLKAQPFTLQLSSVLTVRPVTEIPNHCKNTKVEAELDVGPVSKLSNIDIVVIPRGLTSEHIR